jgi:ribosome-binding factor A
MRGSAEGRAEMSQRMQRMAGEVRAVLGEVLARDEIKDPRVRGVGLITVTHVRISGDLRQARALFTVHGLAEPALEQVRAGLDHASGYFRHAIAKRLRSKVAPSVKFEIDRVFDQAERVEKLLRETAADDVVNDGQNDGQSDRDNDGHE